MSTVPAGSRADALKAHGDARDLLAALAERSLPADQWTRVRELVEQLAETTANVDDARFSAAFAELRGIDLLAATRLGTDPGLPPPEPIRERLNELIHDLTGQGHAPTGDPSGQADGTHGESRVARLVEPGRWRALRGFTRLPTFDRSGLAFAGVDHRERDVPTHETLLEQMRVVRRHVSPGTVEIMVVARPPAGPGEVIALSVGAARPDDGAVLLLPLWLDADGLPVTAIRLTTRAATLDDAITSPFPASLLADADAAAVERSVRLTNRWGRDAWRAIARGRASGDAVRTAVLAGLR
ncbi:hypothetical protein I6A84_03205 [Frankia sp. CNm7]|uniref:CATRA-Associated Small Protein domain-containing protein n=1 Tax=Frankia nepalensis TaxID=1836974 RepID=A0A937RFN4_9ACTN|nr:CATRA system-associated protein [Frankia nepalensis]MBL7501442.1 hypothetical protein [Frankia nepalensis]MBL7509995.1 hypothetical protein [Frankia nepalensis]MBL7517155.1 hypothetical protein [Frankia nepalensis]MBL7627994.1 hypothetical protein [Frankia nepalensis]